MKRARCLVGVFAALLVVPVVLVAAQAPPAARDARPERSPAPPQATDSTAELFRRTLRGADMFKDVQGRADVYLRVALAQARLGDRSTARQTFQKAITIAETVSLDEATYSPHILHWIAQAQAREGFREEALETLRRAYRLTDAPALREIQKWELFVNLVQTQAELGDREGVRATLQRANHFLTTSRDQFAQAYRSSWSVLLQAMAGDLAGAFRMLHEPERFADPKDANRRHQALFDLVRQIKAGDREVAGPILAEAVQAAGSIQQTSPITETQFRNQDLVAIAEAQARLGEFGEALRTAGSISAETPPEGLAESAIPDFLDQQKFKKSQAYATIAKEQLKAGDQAGARKSAEEVVRIVSSMHAERYQTYRLRQAAEVLAKLKAFDAAQRIAERMRADLRVERYEAIADEQRRAGDEAGARKTLQKALQLVQDRLKSTEPDGPDAPPTRDGPRDNALAEVVRIQAKLGDIPGARQSLRSITAAGVEHAALTRLAAARAAAGDVRGALELIEEINAPKAEAEALEAIVGALPRSPAATPERHRNAPEHRRQ